MTGMKTSAANNVVPKKPSPSRPELNKENRIAKGPSTIWKNSNHGQFFTSGKRETAVPNITKWYIFRLKPQHFEYRYFFICPCLSAASLELDSRPNQQDNRCDALPS